MMSTINFNKEMDSYIRDVATEADENMAMALLMAHYQWGSDGQTDYLDEAVELINSISEHLIERPAYVLRPAVNWGGSNSLDPAYYDPMYYPLWYRLTGDSSWNELSEHYRYLVGFFNNNYQTGLLPEWCQADGSSTTEGGNGLGADSYIFGWDAHQISTKWAIYNSWFGTEETDIYAKAASQFADWANSLSKVVQLLVYSGNFVNFTDRDEELPEIIKGDINGDESVNSLDQMILRRYVLGIIPEFPTEDGSQAADINNDGVVNSLDSILLRRLVMGIV